MQETSKITALLFNSMEVVEAVYCVGEVDASSFVALEHHQLTAVEVVAAATFVVAFPFPFVVEAFGGVDLPGEAACLEVVA